MSEAGWQVSSGLRIVPEGCMRKLKTEQEVRDFLVKNPNSSISYYDLDPSLKLSEGFMEDFLPRVIGNINIFNYFKPSDAFIDKYFGDLVKYGIHSVKVKESILDKHSNLIQNWEHVCYYQILSESFIEKYADKVDWHSIFRYQKLSIQFIEKWGGYKVKNFWELISAYQKLPIDFIRKNKDNLDWSTMWLSLNVEVAREFGDLIRWKKINYYGILYFDDEFLDEFGHYLDLKKLVNLSSFNKVLCSESFLEKNLKKIPLNSIFATQAVSPDFILKYSGKFTKTSKSLILNNKKIKKDMEFYEKVGHLFQFSDIPFKSEVLREIAKKNLYKFEVNQFIADADEESLKSFVKNLVV